VFLYNKNVAVWLILWFGHGPAHGLGLGTQVFEPLLIDTQVGFANPTRRLDGDAVIGDHGNQVIDKGLAAIKEFGKSTNARLVLDFNGTIGRHNLVPTLVDIGLSRLGIGVENLDQGRLDIGTLGSGPRGDNAILGTGLARRNARRQFGCRRCRSRGRSGCGFGSKQSKGVGCHFGVVAGNYEQTNQTDQGRLHGFTITIGLLCNRGERELR
jgi:hypothetical protein